MNNFQTQKKYICVNIRDFFQPEDTDGIRKEDLNAIISSFSCPINTDVEAFLKNNAVTFTKKQQSVTYLIFSLEDMFLVGYFSITIKPVTVSVINISSSTKRKLARLSGFNDKTNNCTIAAYLIAQLGRNYNEKINHPITGKMLMNFYQEQNGFRLFGTRITENTDTKAKNKLLQLMSFL